MSLEINFVAYQIALDMKLLGFDEECLAGYIYLQGSGTFELAFYKDRNVDFNTTSNIYVSTPLFSQAFKFFRKKYKLHSHISLGISDEQDISGLEYDEYIYVIEGLNGLDYNNYGESPFYKTPEEAELACLIKLIELVKESKVI
jgi:hypothetical protein